MVDKKTRARLSPNHTYFPIPSLYTTLPQTDVQIIEEVLASDFVAPVPEAEVNLSVLPDGLGLHPVTIIARSMSLLFLWEFRAAYLLLKGYISSNFEASDVTPNVALLLRALQAYADIIYNGSFEAARACLVDLKQILVPLHLEGYNDLTVQIALHEQ